MSDPVRERLVAASALEERHEVLAQVDTAILEGGDGPPLVLLHGQGEYWGVWLPVLDALLTDHRVVVVDLPGHGASRVRGGRLDRDRVLSWLDGLVTATCSFEPPALVGHLVGGAIAARYAIRHADRLAHLVLIDTMGLGWFRPTWRFTAPLLRFMARPNPRSRDRFLRECFVDFDRAAASFGAQWDDLRDYALEQAKQREAQAAVRALMAHLGVPPIPPDDLDRLTVPTTLIHGRHDLQVDLALAEGASRRHGWPLHVIEDARDDPAVEQPDALVSALRCALAASPRDQRADA